MSADQSPSLEELMARPDLPEPTPVHLIRYLQSLERHVQHEAGKVRLLRAVLADEREHRDRAERMVDSLLEAINEPHVDTRHGRALLSKDGR